MAVAVFRLLKSTSLRSSCGLHRQSSCGISTYRGASLLGEWQCGERATSRHRAGLVQSKHPPDRSHLSLSRPAAAGAGAAAAAASAASASAASAAPAAEAAVRIMDEDVRRLIHQLHDSPAQAVLYATGGGFQVGGQAV